MEIKEKSDEYSYPKSEIQKNRKKYSRLYVWSSTG
jgi:hypothetical protein